MVYLFLHKNEILHCDIKPKNIIINSNGILKIIDFGISSSINYEDILISNFINSNLKILKDLKEVDEKRVKY